MTANIPENTATDYAEMDRRVAELVACFEKADAAMRDLPIYTPGLKIEAHAFRVWEDCYIGLLVTPWFMNIVLLPRDKVAIDTWFAGQKVQRPFPSGETRLIVGEDEVLGNFMFKSVASPMNCYQTQDAAVAAGLVALNALLTPAEDETGEGAGTDDAPAEETPAVPPAEALDDAGMDRRRMLRGGFLGGG